MTNMKNVAALIRDDVTTLEAVYEEGGRHYCFKVPYSLAVMLREGDLVLARSNVTKVKVVTVVAVHDSPAIDPDASFTYAWVFDRVSTGILEKLEEEDRCLVSLLEAKRRQQVRDAALYALGIQDPRALLAEAQAQTKREA